MRARSAPMPLKYSALCELGNARQLSANLLKGRPRASRTARCTTRWKLLRPPSFDTYTTKYSPQGCWGRHSAAPFLRTFPQKDA